MSYFSTSLKLKNLNSLIMDIVKNKIINYYFFIIKKQDKLILLWKFQTHLFMLR